MRVLAIAAAVVFTVFVTVFAASANPREVRVLPRWLWVLLCLVVSPIGGIVYLLVGRPGAPFGSPEQGSSRSSAAPDDDPNFLRDLEERIRRERGEGGDSND
ncbi:MAG: hypothetical protein RL605_664 [Actinomycetota bacterium]|jgi:hypothetical protein